MSQIGQYNIVGIMEIRHLVDDAGVPVPPNLGNIEVLGGNNISTTGNIPLNTLTVDLDGTTDHAVQLGNAGGSLTSLGVATDGQILVGSAAADPVWYNLGVGNGIAKVEAAGALDIAGIDADINQIGVVELATDAETIAGIATVPVNTAIRPTSLAAKLGVQTLHGLPIGNTTALAFAWTAEPADGELLIGSTGNTPALGTLTAGAGIAIVNAAGSITISNTEAGVAWTREAGAAVAAVVDHGYINTVAVLTTFTLPAVAALGTDLYIMGEGAGGWLIAQNAAQNIQFGAVSTTVGVGGSLASTNAYDTVHLVCRVADTTWSVLNNVGVLNVV